MAPESERAKMCESTFNWSSNYRCKLPLGHAGLHFSECDNPQFTQSWKDDGEPPTAAELNPPRTLTCSEVVERLAKIAEDSKQGIDERYGADIAAQAIRAHAPTILHSWRERRVQELEEALRTIAAWPFDIMGDCVADAKNLAKRAIAGSWPCPNCGKPLYDSGDHGIIHVHQADQCNSEWREQIRKGAKHE